MARTAITPSKLAVGGSITDPSGTATVAGAGNGVSVAAANPEQIILRVSNGTAGTGTVSVLAGTQPLAPSSGQGPLTVSIGASGVAWVGPFESARFLQSDGSFAVESSVVMTVTAFQVNRH